MPHEGLVVRDLIKAQLAKATDQRAINAHCIPHAFFGVCQKHHTLVTLYTDVMTFEGESFTSAQETMEHQQRSGSPAQVTDEDAITSQCECNLDW